jgi:integrase
MPAAILSAARLQRLKPPPDGVLELWDDHTRGLCLRVFPSGKASWTYRYRPRDGGGRKRVGLGEYPSVGLSEARRRADRLRGEVSGGADPAAERRAQREAATVGHLADRYLAEEIEPARKPATARLYRRYFTGHVIPAIGGRRARDLTHSDVAKLHRAIGTHAPVTANRVVSLIGSLFTWAGRAGEVPRGTNPARDITHFREQPRERFLSSEELARLGDAMREAEGNFSASPIAALRLLLLTGCRVGEILTLKWEHVDFERGLLLLPDSKTGKKTVTLNAPALAVLAGIPRIGAFVILGDNPERPRSDLNRPWRAVSKRAQLDGVRLHDLRHSFASIGAGLGLGLPIVGKLLGHSVPSTTARYAHLDTDPLRRASDRIGGTIAEALGEPMRGRR